MKNLDTVRVRYKRNGYKKNKKLNKGRKPTVPLYNCNLGAADVRCGDW
jgi:hypothetical protein